MSISILNRGASGGLTGIIRVNGLSETDTVTATKDGKTKTGVWTKQDVVKKYRYIKWNITQIKDASLSAVQASEFGFYDQNGNRFQFPAGTKVSATTKEDEGETAQNLIDEKTSTKFFTNLETTVIDTSAIFDLGEGYKIDLSVYNRYYYYTANDVPGRDPVSWTLYGSNDNVNWCEIGKESNQSITSTRNTSAGTWNIKLPPDGWFLIDGIKDTGVWTVTATDGTRTKTQDVLVEVIGLYEIEMDYKLYIVKDGVVQDGFEFEVSYNNYNSTCSGSVTYDPLYLYRKGASETFLKLKTAIDLSGYSTLNAILSSVTTNYANNSRFHVGVADENGSMLEQIEHKIAESTSDLITVTLEVMEDSGCPCLWLQATTVATIGNATVKDFWLE